MSLNKNTTIAAVRSQEDIELAYNASVDTFFLIQASILTLQTMIKEAKSAGKDVFVHIDLTDGLGKDSAGIGLLSKMGADGIISTRANLIRIAKEWNLKTVQRFFIVDSHSIDTAVDSVKLVKPDMVEIMPGVIPKIIKKFCKSIDIPVIAGGLIETKEEITSALEAGATCISTAKRSLWF